MIPADKVERAMFSLDGRTLATVGESGNVGLRDVGTAVLRRTLRCSVTSVSFSLDSRMVATAYCHSVILGDSVTGDKVTETVCRASDTTDIYILCFAFSQDSQLLASGSNDNRVRLWDANTGGALLTLEGHGKGVRSVEFSPVGQLLASSSDDKTVRLWDCNTGVAFHTLQGHTQRVTCVTFSPDGKFLATASEDNTIRLWDVEKGEECYSRNFHLYELFPNEPRRCIRFSPDGHHIVAASLNEQPKIWSARTGNLLHVIEGYGAIHSITFSADGSSIETNTGAIQLPRFLSTSDIKKSSSCSLSVKGHWLVYNSKNLLWLPHEFRPDSVAARDNTIALVMRGDRVIMLSFDFQRGQPWE
jgi:WD40 repeat protein